MRLIQPTFGGTAAVYCVHDRQKRQVVTEEQVAALGRQVGQLYDAKQHKLHRCACCQNLFVDPTDVPRYCQLCHRPLVHTLNGKLPDPTGAI